MEKNFVKNRLQSINPEDSMWRNTILTELNFKAVRSSGPGGQNVNKVASKVILTFDVVGSAAVDDFQKKLILEKLKSKLTSDNHLIMHCDEDRSQLKNKEIVIKRFLELLTKTFFIPKKRKPTKVPKAVIMKRLKDKTNLSEIKRNRKKPNLD
jgi:ribosome-associated protein